MTSNQFNGVLLDVSEQLGDRLDKMKFLCSDVIPKGRLEKIDTGYKLFQILMERNKLGPNNTQLLCSLLNRIQRDDLAEQVKNYETASDPEFAEQQPDETERAKLDAATDVIAQNLGRPWRKLGRKLHLSESKLESISRKHPTDLEETVRELLNVWRNGKGAEATAEELLRALRACEFNLTADKVETEISQMG